MGLDRRLRICNARDVGIGHFSKLNETLQVIPLWACQGLEKSLDRRCRLLIVILQGL